MIYEFSVSPPAFCRLARVAERIALCAVPHHRRHDYRDAAGLRPGAVVHPRAPEKADRASRPRHRPRVSPHQGRHPHHGRRTDSALPARPHHPLE